MHFEVDVTVVRDVVSFAFGIFDLEFRSIEF